MASFFNLLKIYPILYCQIHKVYGLSTPNVITNYKSLFDKVMAIDPKIRYVTIFDMNGDVKYSDHREGVENLLSPEENKKSLQLAINAWKSRNEVSNKIGKGKYALVEYEKIKRITMPLDSDHILYITTDVEADHAPIIYRALRLKQDALHTPDGMP
ncbi:MAG TPA: hypothetical protein VLT10_00245 [Verrucomicrobiae bacterium]|nr:hypothetical protein [Verrucomicrobiae bacterium]